LRFTATTFTDSSAFFFDSHFDRKETPPGGMTG
jgi:hypothetical protein